MTLMLSEILALIANAKTKDEKVALLNKHKSKALVNILIAMYDKKKMIPWLPKGKPPYKPNPDQGAVGALYREQRRLTYLFKGWGGDNLTQVKRESIYIEMLEIVHPDDAELLIKVMNQEGIKGITKSTINKAYGDIIT